MSVIEDFSDLECPICCEIFQDPVSVPCSHVFCQSCISKVMEGNDACCPMCKVELHLGEEKAHREKARQISNSKGKCQGCCSVMRLKRMRDHNTSCEGLRPTHKFKPVKETKNKPKPAPNRSTFKCPYCDTNNLDNKGLIDHCNSKHKRAPKEVVCPICASMPWGDASRKSTNFIDHLNTRHKFEYDTYVDYGEDDDAQLQAALAASLAQS